jgi:serine protease DegQ
MGKNRWKSWLFLTFACASGLAVVFFAQIGEVNSLSSSSPSNTATTVKTNATTESAAIVRETARKITVKIISKGETIGSGILISRQDSTYTILTNDHVLRSADPPYQIQTYDDRIYDATVKLRQTAFNNNDVAVLDIKNVSIDYQIARFCRTIKPKEEVFAAGFPLDYNAVESGKRSVFTFHQGNIFLQLPKAMEGGYQLGYTNEIEKGMSGGPLLNSDGAVVAVNGMHAEPLWGDPYIYKDGSYPDRSINLSQYSWGIPIVSIFGDRSSAIVH